MSCSPPTGGFYSFTAWDTAAATGAALVWRAPTPLALPVVKVLTDGTYLTVVMDSAIRGRRREAILAAARAGQDPAEVEAALDEYARPRARLARVVEYDVPDRAGNGSGELIVLLTTITTPTMPAPRNWPPPTTSGGRKRPATTSSRPTCAAPGGSCAPGSRTWCTRRSGPT